MIYPQTIRATALGGMGRIGAVAAPLVLGVMMDVHLSPNVIFGSLALPMLVSILGVVCLRKNLDELNRSARDLV